ncbi:MAG: aminoglycoside 3-N-acetyltransferase [Acidobacteria bacterium]|nr:aminoglycoside 3-N-acetyltransferase [Acidobacteriota bacterium]
MRNRVNTYDSITGDLRRLGIAPGDVVMAHASVRKLGPVIGGVNTVIRALLDAVGPHGTLLAYVDFERFFEDEQVDLMPVFDKRIAQAARDHGVLHETMRTWPGAIRSDHPDAGMLAIGAKAEWLTADHPFQYGYGPGSPLDKFLQLRGKVLMLGAPLDTITLLHYAEHVADIPDKRVVRYKRLMPEGPQWVWFEEFDTSEPVHDALPLNAFEQIAEAYPGKVRGRVGDADDVYLFDGTELVEFAVEWIKRQIRVL